MLDESGWLQISSADKIYHRRSESDETFLACRDINYVMYN